jgi:hypothetical protein
MRLGLLRIEAVNSSETSVTIYKIARCHISQWPAFLYRIIFRTRFPVVYWRRNNELRGAEILIFASLLFFRSLVPYLAIVYLCHCVILISGLSCIKRWVFPNVSTKHSAAIFRVNDFWKEFFVALALGSVSEVKPATGFIISHMTELNYVRIEIKSTVAL